MPIDYEVQFKDISEDDWNAMGTWKYCDVFRTAKGAYHFALCMEEDGYAVAFAKFCGDYYVWYA